ncbi:MAG: L-histidine N(alpha)-methyltransferase [Synechococcales cyanobacterium C42_A2020_086]|jgi:dimethylhistidine N-methyltransferase|nr:L-histidine N(alpha)-methyltransferase [Synechococcales cyanobacterium M58_A2018_015]MBF2074863.1 L-histidine N(alpha)-methyltransferase [Synechococcales cyanobacterium C42_A2020_086]
MTLSLNSRPNVQLYDLHPPLDDFYAAALAGLQATPKTMPPKFLYDQRGAELFDVICTLEEYYLTRTELLILRTYAPELATLMGDCALLEFGSGSSQKVQTLLDANPKLRTYVGLDISRHQLQKSCLDLASRYPQLEAIAICADYTQPLTLPDLPALRHRSKVGFFPGSSIGNLEPQEVVVFLRHTAMLVGPQGSLLIGVDLKKEPAILEAAYDDTQGVSAAFAFNLLTRINRELGADFQLDQFRYRASYNPIGRIEMDLVSLIDQVVHLGAHEIAFQQGEALRTENSYKYSVSDFQDLAAQAGFQPQQVWTDPDRLFSLHYLQGKS